MVKEFIYVFELVIKGLQLWKYCFKDMEIFEAGVIVNYVMVISVSFLTSSFYQIISKRILIALIVVWSWEFSWKNGLHLVISSGLQICLSLFPWCWTLTFSFCCTHEKKKKETACNWWMQMPIEVSPTPRANLLICFPCHL